MKKKILLTATALCLTSGAFASLPPLAQSSREIQAILKSAETYRLLGGGEIIQGISRHHNGYLVSTAHKQLFVEVHYVPTGKIGPAEFELVFFDPTLAEE